MLFPLLFLAFIIPETRLLSFAYTERKKKKGSDDCCFVDFHDLPVYLLAHQQVQVLAQADALQMSKVSLQAHQKSSV